MAKRGNGASFLGHWHCGSPGGFVETETARANLQGMDGNIVRHGFFHDSSRIGADVLSHLYPGDPRDETPGQGCASTQA